MFKLFSPCVHPTRTEELEHPVYREMSTRIVEIIRSIAEVKYHETGDYGTQPNYYAYVKIGAWDKPYEVTL